MNAMISTVNHIERAMAVVQGESLPMWKKESIAWVSRSRAWIIWVYAKIQSGKWAQAQTTEPRTKDFFKNELSPNNMS